MNRLSALPEEAHRPNEFGQQVWKDGWSMAMWVTNAELIPSQINTICFIGKTFQHGHML